MCRRRSLGVMINTWLGIYVQIRKHTAGPPVDIEVEILSPVNHFQSPGSLRRMIKPTCWGEWIDLLLRNPRRFHEGCRYVRQCSAAVDASV
ncbi:hypothetical protein ACTXT7_007735 [Hymenolepis weldensis]